jgi:hypothetical protein
MSKNNKVNKDHYNQRGRLTQDEAARERQKQRETPGKPAREDVTGRAASPRPAAPASTRRRNAREE